MSSKINSTLETIERNKLVVLRVQRSGICYPWINLLGLLEVSDPLGWVDLLEFHNLLFKILECVLEFQNSPNFRKNEYCMLCNFTAEYLSISYSLIWYSYNKWILTLVGLKKTLQIVFYQFTLLPKLFIRKSFCFQSFQNFDMWLRDYGPLLSGDH